MRNRRGFGLRTRLVALVFLGLAPAFALLLVRALERRDEATEDGRARSLRMAEVVAAEESQAFRDTALVLDLLSRSPVILGGERAECDGLLADVMRRNPVFANLGIARLDGSFRASALPVPPDLDARDRSWFRRALEARSFAVGDYQIGRITGKPTVNAAVPLPPGGEPREVLFAALDLARLHETASREMLPEGATLTLVDGRGTVLVRRPYEAGFVGKPLPEDELRRAVREAPSGTVRVEGGDGVPRLYGFVPVRHDGEGIAGHLFVGIPEGAVLAAAEEALLGGLWALGLVALGALAAAWVFGGLLVVRPVRRLERATDRLREGDRSARAGPPYGPGEIGRLGRAFDALAASLEEERTGRTTAEVSLREREDIFRQMAESIDEVFWVTEPGEKPFKFVSPAFARVWGFPPESLYEDPSLWTESIHPADRRRIQAAISRHEESGGYDETYRIVRPDSSVRWVRDRAFPVRDGQGRVVRIYGIADDVTAARELEEQVQQSQKMEAVGRLAAGVAHDFNNMLTIVRGYTQLAFGGASGEHRKHLEEVMRSADQAAALTRQLLTFSRSQVISPGPLDLNALLGETGGMIRRLIGPSIEVVTLPGRDLSRIHADPNQVRQIVMNLVVNARDAMPEGGRLTLETYDVEVDESYSEGHLQTRPGPYVVLAVTDTGVGMDEKTRARIFEPFFTTKGEGKGTGLGLATVYGIVKGCGGEIWVYSEKGVGTTFKIYFPRYDGRADEAPRAEPEPAVEAPPASILAVEDDASIRSLVYGILRSGRHSVIACASGEEALRELEGFDGKLDLLVADLGLPGIDGLELAARVRRVRPGVRVLLVSGYTEATAASRGGLPPWASYLAKPFGPPELLARVAEVLRAPLPDGVVEAAIARAVRPVDPGTCAHRRIRRLGIQESPVPPYRLHLVHCLACGTTVSLERLQSGRRGGPRRGGPDP